MSPIPSPVDGLVSIREAARNYEQSLPADQRKRMGQFFTGIPLGRLLAHLAITPETRTVLDPMAGHGDLLDAALDVSQERNIPLSLVEGIELDPPTANWCHSRLTTLAAGAPRPEISVQSGNAFDSALLDSLSTRAYDLVITNPPYVRYQALNGNGSYAPVPSGGAVRRGLIAAIDEYAKGSAHRLLHVLAENYSGLADLSVPSWLLAALLVRPGGTLALVVPATWRSRDYADVLRYLMIRGFALQAIVEDTQPGWFSDALVRTHLVVAKRRLDAELMRLDFGDDVSSSPPLWVQVSPSAARASSLVGNAFSTLSPDGAFASWVHARNPDSHEGLLARPIDLDAEWQSLRGHCAHRPWYRVLEPDTASLPLFTGAPRPNLAPLPEPIRALLPPEAHQNLARPEAHDISVSQGLRTGGNRFFYVDLLKEAAEDDIALIQAKGLFPDIVFPVPTAALRPVLRRQSEIPIITRGDLPPGRVLDLRGFVLPEDSPEVEAARSTFEQLMKPLPILMPEGPADLVRRAATVPLDPKDASKRLPNLTAVRTNIRAGGPKRTPRFWYMLPDFTDRHLPAAFVARVNHGTPWVEVNHDPPLLIDANFSTFWSPKNDWSRFALKALLNSTWSRACMEAMGTPLGGGALKLEATHLKNLPLPTLGAPARAQLNRLGHTLCKRTGDPLNEIDQIVLAALLDGTTLSLASLRADLHALMHALHNARQPSVP